MPERLQCIPEALDILARLHRGRNRRPVAETVNRLLEITRAHAGFVLRPSGEQALANVLHVAEQARTYEGTGGISFRGFVERLADDAKGRKATGGAHPGGRERGRPPDDRAQSEGAGVPRGRPGGSDGLAGVREPGARDRRAAASVCRADRGLVPGGAERGARARGGPRRGRGSAPVLRGGHAGPRPPGDPGGGRRSAPGRAEGERAGPGWMALASAWRDLPSA